MQENRSIAPGLGTFRLTLQSRENGFCGYVYSAALGCRAEFTSLARLIVLLEEWMNTATDSPVPEKPSAAAAPADVELEVRLRRHYSWQGQLRDLKGGAVFPFHSVLELLLQLEALLEQCPGLAGCIFLPGDQPLLQRETLEALITAFAQTQKETERAIFRLGARAAHGPDTVVGSPVLFGCGYFPALCTLPEGKGGSVVLKAHPEQVQIVYAQRREELLDADTPEALEELSAIAAQWCVP